MDNALTELYNFIVTYKYRHQGNTPTVKEMQIGCEISSTSVTYSRMMKLVELGRITRQGRNIEIPGGVWMIPNQRETG